MKQKFFLLFLLLFAATFVFSQSTKASKYFTELSIGPSFPIGKFSEKKVDSRVFDTLPSGVAKAGWATNFLVGRKINKSFSLMFQIGYSINKLDPKPYEINFQNIYTNVVADTLVTNHWKLLRATLGVEFSPIKKIGKWNFRSRLFIGECKATIPGYAFANISLINNIPVLSSGNISSRGLDISFCYQFDGLLNYQLGKKINLFFDLSYFQTAPKEHVIYNFTTTPITPVETYFIYKISTINTQIGVRVNL